MGKIRFKFFSLIYQFYKKATSCLKNQKRIFSLKFIDENACVMSFIVKQFIFRFTDLASQTALDTSIDEKSPIPPGQGNVENFTKRSILNNIKSFIAWFLLHHEMKQSYCKSNLKWKFYLILKYFTYVIQVTFILWFYKNWFQQWQTLLNRGKNNHYKKIGKNTVYFALRYVNIRSID